MIALDSCFLIDLYWINSPRHENAVEILHQLEESDISEVLIYYNVFNEFVHTITDSKRFENAMSMKTALDIVDEWCDLEKIKVVFPEDSSFKRSITWLKLYDLGRKRLNDTNMAGCYATQGVTTIITANPKDFTSFGIFKTLDYSTQNHI